MAKFCTNCGRQLEEGTKLCMVCGKLVSDSNSTNINNMPPKKHGIPGWAIALIIIGVILVLFVGTIVISSMIYESDTNTDTEIDEIENIINNEEEKFGTIGDTISNNTWKMTLIDSLYYDVVEGDYYDDVPSLGKYYLIFFFEVENISSESDFFNYLYFSGVEDKYTASVEILLNEPEGYEFLSGEIPAGVKKKGYIAFEVNKNWKEFDVSYKEPFGDDSKLTFSVITDEESTISEA